MLNFSTWLGCWLTALGSLHCNRTCFPFLLENYLSCESQHHAAVLSLLTFYPMFERPSMITDCINYEVGWIFSKCKSDHNFSSVIFHYYKVQNLLNAFWAPSKSAYLPNCPLSFLPLIPRILPELVFSQFLCLGTSHIVFPHLEH